MIDKSILNEALETAKIHLKRAKFGYKKLKEIHITASIFLDEKIVETIDSFIFRFLKLQDFMGQTLFKQLLKATGDYQDSMSMLDVLDKMEKMELIPSSDEWNNYRKERNKLTHEYPNNEDKIIDGLKVALEYFPKLEKILLNVEDYITKIS